jgi:hypothetical protein
MNSTSSGEFAVLLLFNKIIIIKLKKINIKIDFLKKKITTDIDEVTLISGIRTHNSVGKPISSSILKIDSHFTQLKLSSSTSLFLLTI